MQSTIIGVDVAKSVFQVSLADSQRRIRGRRRLTRGQFQRFLVHTPPARVVLEGCASAHHWARFAAGHGHSVKMLHAGYVRAYVRRNKTDAADADALVRADADPDLKPIPVKPQHQQALQSLHRIRAQWQRTRISRINEARSLLAEFGIILPSGATGIAARLHHALEHLPELLQRPFAELIAEIGEYEDKIKRLDRTLARLAKEHPVTAQMLTINGIGPTIATAMLGRVADIHGFKRGRTFASWLGLTPREYSSGSNRTLGAISRRGDSYLRMLLIHGARAAMLSAKRAHAKGARSPSYSAGPWLPTSASAITKPPWPSPTKWRASCGQCGPEAPPSTPTTPHGPPDTNPQVRPSRI